MNIRVMQRRRIQFGIVAQSYESCAGLLRLGFTDHPGHSFEPGIAESLWIERKRAG